MQVRLRLRLQGMCACSRRRHGGENLPFVTFDEAVQESDGTRLIVDDASHVVEGDAQIAPLPLAREGVVVSCEEREAAAVVKEVLHGGVGDGHPIKSSSASAEFVQNHQRALRAK